MSALRCKYCGCFARVREDGALRRIHVVYGVSSRWTAQVDCHRCGVAVGLSEIRENEEWPLP